MHVEKGVLVYDTKPCYCTDGARPGEYEASRSCRYQYQKVQGRFPGNRCPDCGATRQGDHKSFIPTGHWHICDLCHGSKVVPENRTDTLPRVILDTIPLRVFRLNRGATFNESYLGIGCLYSVQDYGAAWGLSDESVLAKVLKDRSESSWTQACAVVGRDDRIPPVIGVFITRDGYSVRAVTPENLALMLRERGEAEAIAVGVRIAGEGGNGTLRGAFR